MMQRTRGHFSIIFEGIKIWQLLSILLVPLFFGFTGRKLNIPDLVTYIIIFWFSTISNTIKYFFTFYTIHDDHILIEAGLINKKKTEIPFNSITTIDLSQNILQRIFKVYKLRLDNASLTSDISQKAEATLVLKANDAFSFKEKISNRTVEDKVEEKETGELQNEPVITASPLDFVILGSLRSKFVYFLTILPFAMGVAGYIAKLFFNKEPDEKLLSTLSDSTILLAAIVTFLMIYLASFIFSIGRSLITFFGFHITSRLKTIDVEFGLFLKKKYSLPKAKINGIILRQNLLMQMFGYCSIDVCVVGYGNKADQSTEEKGILFPFASIGRAKEIIITLLPEFDSGKDIRRPPKKALRYFFIRPLPIITAAALTGVCFTKIFWLILLFVIFLILTLINSGLEYRNSSISLAENAVTISNGGFKKRTVVIKSGCIESVAESASIFKRRNSVTSLEVSFLAPAGTSKVIVRNIDISNFRELENRLVF